MSDAITQLHPVTVSHLAASVRFSADAKPLTQQAEEVAELYAKLKADELRADAILVLPHLMSKQAAVWWGCLCVWDHLRVSPPAQGSAIRAAVQAAVAWVKEPTDDARKLAEPLGKEVGMDHPAGCLAMAVAWSAGSLSPPDLPEVPPPTDLTAKLVASAVLLSAVLGDPTKIQQNYEQFLAIGEEVRDGINTRET